MFDGFEQSTILRTGPDGADADHHAHIVGEPGVATRRRISATRVVNDDAREAVTSSD
jgi:hypothetical protein